MTNTTNESEAMEVARKVLAALDMPVAAFPAHLAEVARVIATALEARDTRIAELEGALIECDGWLAALDGDSPISVKEMRDTRRKIATLTKEEK